MTQSKIQPKTKTGAETSQQIYEASPIAAVLKIPREQAEDILAACKEYVTEQRKKLQELQGTKENTPESLADALLSGEYNIDSETELPPVKPMDAESTVHDYSYRDFPVTDSAVAENEAEYSDE